ncbi:MAG: type II CAAX endopeptidase family protein [Gemmatimonadota bacterium]
MFWDTIGRLALYGTASLFVAIGVGWPLPGSPVWGGAALLVGAMSVGALFMALEGRGPGRLGFYLAPDAIRESMSGLGLGVAVGSTVVGLLAVTGGLTWVPQTSDGTTWLGGAVLALLFFSVPAAAEEAWVRGYPLLVLREAGGAGVAVGVTSAVFGLLHLGNPGASVLSTANVILAGVWLGVLTVRTRSLWWATGAHVGWNWVHGFIADVPVSGLQVVDAPGYEGVAQGPWWWGGEGFGPEGSVASTAVLLIATVVCARAGWMTPGDAARRAHDMDEQTDEA